MLTPRRGRLMEHSLSYYTISHKAYMKRLHPGDDVTTAIEQLQAWQLVDTRMYRRPCTDQHRETKEGLYKLAAEDSKAWQKLNPGGYPTIPSLCKAIRASVLNQYVKTGDQEMERKSIPTKQFIWWRWWIIGVVLLIALPACAQVVRKTSPTEVTPLHQLTGGLISIRPLGTRSGGRTPRGPQVSIVGDQIHIEIFSPTLIKIQPPQESSPVKWALEHPGEKVRAGRGPIIIAPTP
jgi:hypothetical protein